MKISEPNPSKKEVEEYLGKELTDDEYDEIVFNMTSFLEMLAEIEKELGISE